MVLLYANASDLATWSGAVVPSNADQLLRSASRLVRRDTRTAVYEVHPSGLPSDADISEAMRDAVCAQATYWAANGLDPSAGPAAAVQTRRVSSSGIGGATVNYETPAEASAVRMASLDTLCDEAVGILADAGLAGHPWVAG